MTGKLIMFFGIAGVHLAPDRLANDHNAALPPLTSLSLLSQSITLNALGNTIKSTNALD